MKNIRLNMVVIATVCLLNVAKAATLSGVVETSTASECQTKISPYVSLNYMESTNSQAAPATANWALCYESDRIYIYERWLKRNGGDSIRERKGDMMVNCTVDAALKYITNYENQKNWMKNVEDNILIKRKSDTNWITYTVFSLPWPFSDKDVVSEYHVKEIIPGSYIQIKINSIKNMIKETDGISRINNYDATWTITKINDKKVSISFCASSDAKPVAPLFIQDPIMRKTFFKNLLNLRTILE